VENGINMNICNSHILWVFAERDVQSYSSRGRLTAA
jgi:hypothetical protein